MDPEVYRRAREFRSQLLASEESARLAILEAYSWSQSAINQSIESLIRYLIERGEPITGAQLTRLDRWQDLLGQIEREARRFGQAVAMHVSHAQRFQITQARAQALELMRLARPMANAFTALPTGAIEQLVGFLQDGNPIATAIEQAFPALADRVKRELVVGLAQGKGLKAIARRVAATMEPPAGKRGQGTGPLAAALRIARTEILRAHREASRETYSQNADVVQGWIWLSSRGVHTCAACLAMDGTTHPLGAPMGSHPNCRCTMLPWIIGDPAPTDTGQAWLERQSESVQAEVLGRSAPDREAAKAFRAGRVRLADFVDESHSDVWGVTRTARSLDQALESKTPLPPPKPQLDPLSEQLFGDRKIAIKRQSVKKLTELEREFFGRKLTTNDWADLIGAPAGASVKLIGDDKAIIVNVEHPLYDSQSREIRKLTSGVTIYNSLWEVKKSAPRGVGTRVFARQVWSAQRLGVSAITVHAFGSPASDRWGGYYVWPRLGFDAVLTADKKGRHSKLIGTPFESAKTLQELFAMPGGPDWWKHQGWDTHAVIDLQEGSESLKMHRKYLELNDVHAY